MPLSRISWLVTVGICLVAALLLLLNGYYGYSLCLLAVGAAGRGRTSAEPVRPAIRSSGSRWMSTSAPRSRAPIASWSSWLISWARAQARALHELDVEVDVAAAAGAARAELVEAHHLARTVLLDRLPDGVELLGRERLVDQGPRRPVQDPDPREHDRDGHEQCGGRVERLDAGDLHERQAGEHAGRRERVGAEVGGVALERRRVGGPGAPVEIARDTTRFASAENAITAMPNPIDSISEPSASRRTDSNTITPAPIRISIPSIAAARFSTFWWP